MKVSYLAQILFLTLAQVFVVCREDLELDLKLCHHFFVHTIFRLKILDLVLQGKVFALEYRVFLWTCACLSELSLKFLDPRMQGKVFALHVCSSWLGPASAFRASNSLTRAFKAKLSRQSNMFLGQPAIGRKIRALFQAERSFPAVLADRPRIAWPDFQG
jgi:hypothetical protein